MEPPRAAGPPAHQFLGPPEQSGELGRLGGYRVLEELGRGGMGVVFKAEDPGLKRLVALKVMLPKFAADPVAKARFLREARSQAAVEHDHVAAIFQVGEDAGTPFIAMPLLRGLTLAAALKANPRPPLAEVVRIAREMAEGLSAAHRQGLVHRDIKPANVWLEGDRLRVKILDFGLARAAEGEEAVEGTERLTTEGAVIGTPAFMSPEQAAGDPVDHRTDLFSLGVVLYQLTTGRLPFTGKNATAVLVAVAHENPPPPAELVPDIPPPLNALVLRLLAKDPAARPGSAADVADELRQIELGLSAAMPVVALPLDPVPGDPFAHLDSTELASSEVPPEVAGKESSYPARGDSARSSALWLAASAAGLLLVVGLAVVLYRAATRPEQPAAKGEEPPKPQPPRPPAPPPTGPVTKDPPAAPAFFTGKDLTGWKATPPEAWKVVDGEIVGLRPPGAAGAFDLLTERVYRDFELSFQVRRPVDTDRGGTINVRFRSSAEKAEDTPAVVRLWNTKAYLHKNPAVSAAIRPGEFDDVTIRCVGRQARVVVNGTTLVDGEFPMPEEGKFYFLYAGQTFGEVVLRNIRFTDLSGADPAFFNGKDLAGLVSSGSRWRVEGGEIVADGVDKAEWPYRCLYSPRTYTDYEITFKAKVKSGESMNAVADVLMRCEMRDQGDQRVTPIGLKCGLGGRHWGMVGTGSKATDKFLPPEVIGKTVKPEDYNEVSVRHVGKRVRVTLNGTVVVDEDIPSPRAAGAVGWLVRRGPGELRVRDIRFTDLGGADGPPKK